MINISKLTEIYEALDKEMTRKGEIYSNNLVMNYLTLEKLITPLEDWQDKKIMPITPIMILGLKVVFDEYIPISIIIARHNTEITHIIYCT